MPLLLSAHNSRHARNASVALLQLLLQRMRDPHTPCPLSLCGVVAASPHVPAPGFVVTAVGATETVTTLVGATSGGYLDAIGTAARLSKPRSLSLSPDGTLLVVADVGNNAVRVITLASAAVTTLTTLSYAPNAVTATNVLHPTSMDVFVTTSGYQAS